jgi:hypothetical protein
MKEQRGNLWELAKNKVLCITTNGTVKTNGECVMGRGIALQAKQRYPGIAKAVGDSIRNNGNIVRLIAVTRDYKLVTFPVKHNWYEKADIDLIAKSCKELVALADRYNMTEIFLPRPGCGNGKLNYADVKPILEQYLDDRFIVVTY